MTSTLICLPYRSGFSFQGGTFILTTLVIKFSSAESMVKHQIISMNLSNIRFTHEDSI